MKIPSVGGSMPRLRRRAGQISSLRTPACWTAAAALGGAVLLGIVAAPSPLAADGPTIAIGSPLTDCPGLTPCYLPASATGTAGVAVTWVNRSIVGAHTATADNGAFDTKDIGPGKSVSIVIPVGTYGYHDVYAPSAKGTITITAAPGSSGGATSGGSGPAIAGSVPDATVKPGQHLGQVTGPAAGKPRVVAAKTPAAVFGPGTLGPQGSTALPPIDATPDPNSLPPITGTPIPRPGALASTPAGSSGGRSATLYLAGALLFLLVGLGAGGFYGFRWWRRRSAVAMPDKASAA
ncbi:MAG: hypothetical protein ABR564_01510 [Candidatus Dormibacteria bacterium]